LIVYQHGICLLNGKSVAGSSSVPFHRLTKPEGVKLVRDALFSFCPPRESLQVTILMADLLLEHLVPGEVVAFILSEDPPRKEVGRLKTRVLR
jgi:hypothetical protein